VHYYEHTVHTSLIATGSGSYRGTRVFRQAKDYIRSGNIAHRDTLLDSAAHPSPFTGRADISPATRKDAKWCIASLALVLVSLPPFCRH
jgi:hypothetical protein